MLVREVMTADPVTVRPDTHVKEALVLLAEHRVTSLPVLGPHGRLAGVVSEADLIRDLVREDPRAHELPLDDPWHDRPSVVEEVMTPHAVTVHPDTELVQAVELITSTTVKSVPVVDERERVVGMLSRSDVVRVMARADGALAADVEQLLASAGLSGWSADVDQGVVTLSRADDSGPEGTGLDDTGPDADREVAHLLAGTVPGVVDVARD